jgi:broad specificity phosphatase PhoE
MTTWWFVRHGESTANAEEWASGHVDAPLTARGVAQAEAIREQLATLAPHRVVSSDLSRAWRTCELAWGARAPVAERFAELRERSAGAWARMTYTELRASGHMATLMSWDGCPPDGESQADVARRALAWLAAADDGRDTLIFAHGALIRSVVGLLDDVPRDQIASLTPANCGVVTRVVAPGTWARLLAMLAATPRG